MDVTVEALSAEFDIDEQMASHWLSALKETSCLLKDGRVNPAMPKESAEFSLMLAADVAADRQPRLHKWLLSTGLKYTAGRYFRPGMIFAYLYR